MKRILFLAAVAASCTTAAVPAHAQFYYYTPYMVPAVRYLNNMVMQAPSYIARQQFIRQYGPPLLGWAAGPLRYETTPAYYSYGRPVYYYGPGIR